MPLGIIKSVEQCLLTVSTGQGYADYTLTKGQDPANCVPFGTYVAAQVANSTPNQNVFDFVMLDGPPRVRARRGGATGTHYTAIYVVEFEPTKIKVQQGSWSIIASATTDTVTLGDSIVKNNSALITYYRYNSSSVVPRDMMVASKVLSNTQIQMERSYTASTVCDGAYYVMEALNGEWSVTHYDSGNLTGVIVNYTIPSVTVNRTFLIGSNKTDETSTAIEGWAWFCRLQNATSVQLYRWNASSNDRYYFQVIECADDSIFVQHRYVYEATLAYNEWTLPQAVDPQRAIAHNANTHMPLTAADGSAMHLGVCRYYLKTNGTVLRTERFLASPDDCFFVASVIEFTGTEFFCEGTVTVDDVLTSGIDVNLFRREDDMLVGTDTTIAGGVFAIPSRFHDEYHYLVAKSLVSGTNSVVLDWLYPTVS